MLGLVVLALANWLGIQIIVAIQQIVDGLKSETLIDLNQQLLWVFAMALGVLGFRIASRQFLLGIGRTVEWRLRNTLFEHFLTLPQTYYSAHPTGELMSRMINDVRALRYLFGGGILLGFNTLFAYCITLPVMWGYSWKLTLYAFTVLPVAIFLMSRVSRKVKQAYLDVQEVIGDVSTVAQENFSGMAVIQAFVREPIENQRFQKESRRYFDASVTLIRRRVWLFVIMASVTTISILIVLAEGGREFMIGQITYGVFAAFVLMLETLSWPTAAMGWVVTMWQQGLASIHRIDEVLVTESNLVTNPARQMTSTPDNDNDTSDKESKSEVSSISLEIKNLSFIYENPYVKTNGKTLVKPLVTPLDKTLEKPTSAESVLKQVNLKAQGGETIAIVGAVGSGKSTLLKLLPKLYPMGEGHIFINGQDINRYDLYTLRGLVSLMPQQSELFSAAIKDNIAFPLPESEFDAIAASAQTAAVHDEILNFDQQYQTLVGERGVSLSGGQRQRTALARTLMVTPAILLLDDPFSSVDSQTEQAIIDSLDARKVFQNKLTLIATHRLSVVQKATRVLVMDKGRIIADGSHDKLLANEPFYQRLYQQAELQTTLENPWEATDNPDSNNRHSNASIPTEERR